MPHTSSAHERGRRARLVAAGLGLTVAASSLALVGAAQPASAAPAAKRVLTKYAFSSTGFGTKVTATDASLRSGMTAYSLIGCTKAAGVHNANKVSSSNLNDQVRVGSVTTDQKTLVTRAGSSMVQSVTRVSSIQIGDSSLGFRITNLQGVSRAYATKKGRFNAASTFTFGSLTPLGGTSLPPPLNQPADVIIKQLTANGPVTIPGLGVVKVGRVARAVSRLAAQSGSIGMQIHLFGQDQANGGGDDSDVLIGRSYARINKSATHGVFSGGAWGLEGSQLNGTVSLGRNPYSPMQCEGTRGKIRSTVASSLDLANLNQLLVGSVQNRVFGVQNLPRGGATGWTESSTSGMNWGNGQLQMTGVVARAKVIRSSSHRFYPTAMQRIGSIKANGQTQPVPGPGQSITIPGVAKIEVPRPIRTAHGILVIGARVTLLSGSAANSVINVASAKIEMRAF